MRRAPTKGKILVVDDEANIRQLLDRQLRSMGYDVDCAEDGEDAIGKVQPGRYQLAISDLSMPKIGGIDFIRRLRHVDPDIEIILMTGYATVEAAVEAMKAGAYDFVQKPFDLAGFLALVEKSLEKRQMRTVMSVYESSRTIFEAVEIKDLLPKICACVRRLLRADDVFIVDCGADGGLSVTCDAGENAADRRREALQIAEELRGLGRADWISPLVREHGDQKDGSSLTQALFTGDIFNGCLHVRRVGAEPFTDDDQRCATILGSQAAQALLNARLFERLQTSLDDLRAAQEQLVQSEKLACIGQLAAGVAHELNNPLTGISGFAELLLDDPNLTASVRGDIDTIHQQSLRCKSIIQNLLQFSRRRKGEWMPIDVGELVRSTIALTSLDHSTKSFEIVQRFPQRLPLVEGDATQLQQVILNLITNAGQAMESSPERRLSISAGEDKGWIVVRFADTGCGISKDVLSRIFDPFFTTKPVGKGTGLGLSICYGIVDQHGGKLSAESEVGVGSTFTLRLKAQK